MMRRSVRNTALTALAALLLFTGCAVVRESPQTDTVYRESAYRGQVSRATLEQLDKEYPEGFYEELRAAVPEGEKLRIGVSLFTGSGTVANLAGPTTEIFSTALIQSGLFKVYDRDKLDRVVAEVEFGMTGLVDPATAQQVGRLAGVELLLAGSLTENGGVQRTDVRIIDAATGEAVLAEKMEGAINAGNSGFLARRLVGRLAEKYYKSP